MKKAPLIHTYFSPQLSPVLGALAAKGVEVESFSAPADRAGDQWFCVGLSSPLADLDALKPAVQEAAQITF